MFLSQNQMYFKYSFCQNQNYCSFYKYINISLSCIFYVSSLLLIKFHLLSISILVARDLTYYSPKVANHLKIVSMRNLSNRLILESQILPSITHKPLSIRIQIPSLENFEMIKNVKFKKGIVLKLGTPKVMC